jgi:hypothetical protein
MRVEIPAARAAFPARLDGKRDVAAAGLAGNAMSFGRQIVVIDVIDLALVVTGQDRRIEGMPSPR